MPRYFTLVSCVRLPLKQTRIRSSHDHKKQTRASQVCFFVGGMGLEPDFEKHSYETLQHILRYGQSVEILQEGLCKAEYVCQIFVGM